MAIPRGMVLTGMGMALAAALLEPEINRVYVGPNRRDPFDDEPRIYVGKERDKTAPRSPRKSFRKSSKR